MIARSVRRLVRPLGFVAAVGCLALWSAPAASAHPLGNFTTNTSLEVRFLSDEVTVRYTVDMAELPALRVRQQLTGDDAGALQTWSAQECARLGKGITIGTGEELRSAVFGSASGTFQPGQAGLSTLRLTCTGAVALPVGLGDSVVIDDANYGGRAGWRETVVPGAGTRSTTDAPAVSPTGILRTYDAGLVPLRALHTEVTVNAYDGAAASGTPNPPASDGSTSRGSDGLSTRFQSLLSDRAQSPLVIVGALMIAMVLGAGHALAPGHGKSLMAAYVVGRRGGRRDLVVIGGTVALTHTVGVLVFTGLALASGAFAPDRTVRATGALSGVLVMGVGFNLLRTRWKRRSAAQLVTLPASSAAHEHEHEHEHSSHTHADHSHAGHLHGGHDHAHDAHDAHDAHVDDRARPSALRARFRPTPSTVDPNRWIVTEHRHGGGSHTHVLPKPGTDVSRRELAVMGVAGGMVPSPSALLVLLGAIALDRVAFGLALIIAYGIGLALTLIGAGLLMARMEHTVRRIAGRHQGGVMSVAVSALPLVSACGLIGGGALFVVRSMAL